MRCESCGFELRVVKETKRRTTYEDCPRCVLCSAGISAVHAAALYLGKQLDPKCERAHMNEYGIFADVNGAYGQIGTPEMAAPFMELHNAIDKVAEPRLKKAGGDG